MPVSKPLYGGLTGPGTEQAPVENLYTPNSIRTASGRYVNILELDPDTITIEDIAHALAHTPRFGGHLPVFFSVAQHSICVFHAVRQLTHDPKILLQALLHDASEYLIGDMPSPIKQHLPCFQEMETRIMHVIADKFGFPWPMHPLVKQADRDMLESEWKYIMLRTDGIIITDMHARETFLKLFHELTA